jgi:hypothetical protein
MIQLKISKYCLSIAFMQYPTYTKYIMRNYTNDQILEALSALEKHAGWATAVKGGIGAARKVLSKGLTKTTISSGLGRSAAAPLRPFRTAAKFTYHGAGQTGLTLGKNPMLKPKIF